MLLWFDKCCCFEWREPVNSLVHLTIYGCLKAVTDRLCGYLEFEIVVNVDLCCANVLCSCESRGELLLHMVDSR